MKSLKLLSPIVPAFIKSFSTAGGTSICDERPTSFSLCLNGFCQLLMILQQCTTFSPFLIRVLPKSLEHFFLFKIGTFFEVCRKSSDELTWQYPPLNCSTRCTYSNYFSRSLLLFVDRLYYDLAAIFRMPRA